MAKIIPLDTGCIAAIVRTDTEDVMTTPSLTEASERERTPVEVMAERLAYDLEVVRAVDKMASGSIQDLRYREHRLMKAVLKATENYRDLLALAAQYSEVQGKNLTEMVNCLDSDTHDCCLDEAYWTVKIRGME